MLLLSVCSYSPISQADTVRVAAASDLIHVLPELAKPFQANTGHTLRISFGSSGNLARQIIQGAPFDIFFSANERYVFHLTEQGLTQAASVIYAVGRLALFVPKSSAVTIDRNLSGIKDALDNGSLRRLAIANPEHAPYGIAARSALQNAELWKSVQQKFLVIGENAAQAAQFAVSNNADAALIPYSIAVAPRFSARGNFVLLADELHPPLRQRMVILKGARATARILYDFMQTSEAKTLMARYGFEEPAVK